LELVAILSGTFKIHHASQKCIMKGGETKLVDFIKKMVKNKGDKENG
jgi:hypothetical protein